MKYIPGFKFIMGAGSNAPRSASLLQNKNKPKPKNDGEFLVGHTYVLHNIKPGSSEPKFYYTFIDIENKSKIILSFSSIEEADQKISSMSGV